MKMFSSRPCLHCILHQFHPFSGIINSYSDRKVAAAGSFPSQLAQSTDMYMIFFSFSSSVCIQQTQSGSSCLSCFVSAGSFLGKKGQQRQAPTRAQGIKFILTANSSPSLCPLLVLSMCCSVLWWLIHFSEQL